MTLSENDLIRKNFIAAAPQHNACVFLIGAFLIGRVVSGKRAVAEKRAVSENRCPKRGQCLKRGRSFLCIGNRISRIQPAGSYSPSSYSPTGPSWGLYRSGALPIAGALRQIGPPPTKWTTPYLQPYRFLGGPSRLLSCDRCRATALARRSWTSDLDQASDLRPSSAGPASSSFPS
jgi:hypothetical protein